MVSDILFQRSIHLFVVTIKADLPEAYWQIQLYSCIPLALCFREKNGDSDKNHYDVSIYSNCNNERHWI